MYSGNSKHMVSLLTSLAPVARPFISISPESMLNDSLTGCFGELSQFRVLGQGTVWSPTSASIGPFCYYWRPSVTYRVGNHQRPGSLATTGHCSYTLSPGPGATRLECSLLGFARNATIVKSSIISPSSPVIVAIVIVVTGTACYSLSYFFFCFSVPEAVAILR